MGIKYSFGRYSEISIQKCSDMGHKKFMGSNTWDVTR